MIQENIMNILADHIDGLTWTVDYYTDNDNTGTVYGTGGEGNPDLYDTAYRHPTYQVYIRSSDWDYAKTAAEMVYDLLHKRGNFNAAVDYTRNNRTIFTKNYHIFLIEAMSDPIRVGEVGGVMEYSINFDVTLIEKKGVKING